MRRFNHIKAIQSISRLKAVYFLPEVKLCKMRNTDLKSTPQKPSYNISITKTSPDAVCIGACFINAVCKSITDNKRIVMNFSFCVPQRQPRRLRQQPQHRQQRRSQQNCNRPCFLYRHRGCQACLQGFENRADILRHP